LSTLGLASLLFDFRGRGHSDGDPEELSVQTMQDDLRAVLEYVGKDNSYPKIAAVLRGSGAVACLPILAESIAFVRAVVWSPFVNLVQTELLVRKAGSLTELQHYSRSGKSLHLRGHPYGSAWFDGLETAPTLPEGLKACAKRPVLVLHATGDSISPLSEIRAVVTESASQGRNHELSEVPGERQDLAANFVGSDEAWLRPSALFLGALVGEIS
jgi:alpha-beta hydrolase superfamily lysophospholipase